MRLKKRIGLIKGGRALGEVFQTKGTMWAKA